MDEYSMFLQASALDLFRDNARESRLQGVALSLRVELAPELSPAAAAAKFLSEIVRSMYPLLQGRRPPVGRLPLTTVVLYTAGTMSDVMSSDGPVFLQTGAVPRFLALAPLTEQDMSRICDAQPELRGRWRLMPEFRLLLQVISLFYIIFYYVSILRKI